MGPQVTEATFAEAEKLLRVQLTPAERAQAARSWGAMMAHLPERRAGPRQLALGPELAPATRWDPRLLGEGAGAGTGPARERFVRSAGPTPPLPARDEDIAHAPVALLSRWVRARALTSERLTGIYLERIRRLDPRLLSVITRTEEFSLRQARAADKEFAAGKYCGPLHGIPWGPRTWWTPRASPPPTAPSPSATACPPRTPCR